jgi:hypothetical protein
LSRASLRYIPAKDRNTSTPMNGCRIRVHGPPPNSTDRKNSDGWNIDRPDSAVQKNRMTSAQWLIRSPSE